VAAEWGVRGYPTSPPGKRLDKEEKECRKFRIVSEMLISPTVTILNEQANFLDSRLILVFWSYPTIFNKKLWSEASGVQFVHSNQCTVLDLCIVKEFHYRSWQALSVPRVWGSQISRQSTHEGGKVISPMHRPPLLLQKYTWYSFLLEAESTAGP